MGVGAVDQASSASMHAMRAKQRLASGGGREGTVEGTF